MRNRIISLKQNLFCRSFLVLLIAAVFLAGCSSDGAFVSKANYYFKNPSIDLSTLGRVAVVELNNDTTYPQASSDITEALFQALQKKQVFGLSIVRQNNPAWRSLQLENDSTYTLEQTSSIRETLKCDGILLGCVTEYRPFPHMAVGLRLKILDLRSGQLLWALEQIWDITDKQTERRVRKYYRSQKSEDFSLSSEHLVSISPLEFTKFVCSEVAETL